jgi:GAF domain-containing protein
MRVTILGGVIFLLGGYTFVMFGLSKNGIAFLLAFVFVNAILLNQRAGIIAIVVNALFIGLVGAGYQTGYLTMLATSQTLIGTTAQWVNTVITITMVSGMMVAAGSSVIRSMEQAIIRQEHLANELEKERQNLENTINQRTHDLNRRAKQLEAASQVARSISSFNDLDSLLKDTIELIRQQFGFYHAGLFLTDDANEYAVLKAATGEVGQRMLERNHRLKIGEEGIVGYAISKNEPRIAMDVGEDAVHFKNPDLPNTRSEMALPLRSGGKVIGALDVQSENEAAFGNDDIRVLNTIADELALAIEKVNLLTQLKNSLAEVEASYQQYTRKAWHSHLRSAKRNYAFRFHRQHIEVVDEGYVEVDQALKSNRAVVTTLKTGEKGVQTLVAVPIKLRGEPLGVINLRFEASHVPQDTVDLLENTANRLALALENARLLEELQQRAERERQIGTIVSKVRSRADIDSILRTTAEELGRSLGVAEVLVQLKEK